jgi:UDP:flavonoid glycosyltransferase YjiC (YdhE family)
MIPLASRLREMNNNIFIGAGEEHMSLFRNEMPGLTYINFPGFKPRYSKFLPQYLSLLFKTPLLLYHIIREHSRLKKIISDHAIDIVISDNRFGLWNRKITTVYVTHLPLIPLPKTLFFLEFIGIVLHRAIIKRYNFCYIPDLPGELNLSGRLSHDLRLPSNVRYIGLLSRFRDIESNPDDSPVAFRHNTVILSGPEPQREMLKQKLTEILKNKEPVTIILGGRPYEKDSTDQHDNIIYYNHLPARKMKELIAGSDYIITRSGYTTIMELISLGCSALLIPTPGQTEQEYLARYLEKKSWFATITQKKISTEMTFPAAKSILTNELMEQSSLLLKEALKELSEKKQHQGIEKKTKGKSAPDLSGGMGI